MCDEKVGVAKRLDVERLSKEVSDLIKELDREVKGDEVNIPVQKVKRITEDLKNIIKK